MSTLDVTLLRPDTKIVVRDVPMGTEHPATVLQQFNGCLYYLADDVALTTSGNAVEWVTYEQVWRGDIDIRVLDDSAALDVEVVDGPPGGLTIEERVGVEITDLTHDDPAQSGPPTTHIAHPVGGYDREPSEGVTFLSTVLHLPIPLLEAALRVGGYEIKAIEPDRSQE